MHVGAGVATHQLRRRWAGIGAVLALSVVVAGILGILALRMERHEAVLDVRGRLTTGVVIDSSDRLVRRHEDFADVRYDVDGREYEARMPVDESENFPAGAEIGVIYDPDRPGHAKPAEGWSPSYEDVSITAWVLLGFGVVDTARRGVRTLLLLQAARQPRHTTAMRAESFSTRRWWQKIPRQWAALWPIDANPLVDDVQLYVPIEGVGRRTGLNVNASSLVLGAPEPQRLLVIIQGDQVVWPRGRARTEEPAGELTDW